MSNTASIANFAVDRDGNEIPIRYKASDLVNKMAPQGYHWRLVSATEQLDLFVEALRQKYCGRPFAHSRSEKDYTDYYICERDAAN